MREKCCSSGTRHQHTYLKCFVYLVSLSKCASHLPVCLDQVTMSCFGAPHPSLQLHKQVQLIDTCRVGGGGLPQLSCVEQHATGPSSRKREHMFAAQKPCKPCLLAWFICRLSWAFSRCSRAISEMVWDVGGLSIRALLTGLFGALTAPCNGM